VLVQVRITDFNVYRIFVDILFFIAAFGGALLYAPALILVNQYFDRHRSVATGIASAGSGLGVFIFPPLIEVLFNHYGFSGAFIILSAICFNNCISGALYRPLERSISASKLDETESNTDVPVACGSISSIIWNWLNKHFGLSYLGEFVFASYCTAMTLITLAYVSGHQLVVDWAVQQGVPESQAVFLLSIIGITDTVGRLLSGFVFDLSWFRPRRKLFYCLSVFGSGAFFFGLGFSSSYISFAVCSALQGFFNGITVCQRAVIIVDIVGLDKLSACFGLCVACQGFGVLLGPMLAGSYLFIVL
jgi:MFS family permease